jgi:hypothetical protein
MALWMIACGQTGRPELRELSIRAPGLEIVIDGRGNGTFLKRSSGEKGRFSLTSSQYDALVERMEVFRNSSEAIDGADIEKLVERDGRCDGDYVTDNGGILFHWLGASIDQYYSVDYGCDRDKYAVRNAELKAILRSLPVPEPDSLP